MSEGKIGLGMSNEAGSGSGVRVNRKFSAEYKKEILERLDAAAASGELGAVGKILREEALYSSLVYRWRKQRDDAVTKAMGGGKRGPKGNRDATENKRLKARITELEARLDTSQKLTVAQGKAFALLQELSLKSNETQ